MTARTPFDPQSSSPYKISCSGLDQFHECPWCFYFDERLRLACPPGFPFGLTLAVEPLIKREFNSYRARPKPHPLMKKAGIRAKPFAHPDRQSRG